MKSSLAFADEYPEDEIAALVLTLDKTQQRLQQLAGGGADAVALPGGHFYLLHEAQEKLQRSEIAQSEAAALQISILNALPAHIARCPRTAAALAHAPRCEVAGRAPTAFFSILDASTTIPAHTGVTNTRLTVHLPLIVPPDCRFRVGGTTREVRAGRAWVFDDTIEHEAWNGSDMPRAILIFDIWNPFLSEVERDMVRTATEVVIDYYQMPAESVR